jgi:dsRNA-specific ribonuclease
MYRAMPTANQGQLTDLKCSLINNKALGLVGLRLHLHECVLTSSQTLLHCFESLSDETNVNMCEDGVMDETGGGQDGAARVSDAKGIKILADVVEAVVGAVFLDSDCSLLTVQRVIQETHIIPPALLTRK